MLSLKEINFMSDILYDADGVRIYTDHSFEVNDKISENLDFFLDYKGNIYAGTAFSLNCVIASILEIISDKTVVLEEVVCKQI